MSRHFDAESGESLSAVMDEPLSLPFRKRSCITVSLFVASSSLYRDVRSPCRGHERAQLGPHTPFADLLRFEANRSRSVASTRGRVARTECYPGPLPTSPGPSLVHHMQLRESESPGSLP